MEITVTKLNRFLFFKLPSAFLCGVRVKSVTPESSTVTVRHRWINQNPFNSMYFAVQAMAAELSTGVQVMSQIKASGRQISMLVASNKSVFTKKATGKITFTCNDAGALTDAIKRTVATGEGQTFWMTSIGTNENGDQVSRFDFEWTIRMRAQR